ncbi:MAG: thymidine kinase [Myxococcota bacterium]|nr:thymidine kinase [Myxococcota bacterium]
MAKLYFYYSAMNAGKSAMLLQSDHNYRERGMHTLLLTCRLDDRYGEGVITSRIGLQRPATLFDSQKDLLVLISKKHAEQKINCVLIDEAQFLQPVQVLQLSLAVDRLNIPILCYGLRTDFRGEPFPGSQYLLAWADELNELKTICESGKKAIMNARMDAEGVRVWDGRQVEIGHNYISMSRREFMLEKASPLDYQIPSEAILPNKSTN